MAFINKILPRKSAEVPHTPDFGQSSRPQASRLPPITASQFLSHVEQICEDEGRKALSAQVAEVDPVEVIAFARRLCELRARHVALGLTVAAEKTSPTSRSHEELSRLRARIDEMDAAFTALKEAIRNGQLAVRGVAGPST